MWTAKYEAIVWTCFKIYNVYKASQELINILLKNDFRDKSYLYVSDYSRYSKKDCYNPHVSKRIFGIGHNKRNLVFHFDSNIFFVCYKACRLMEADELDENQLRSIITFFKCSHYKQNSIRSHCEIENAGEMMLEQRSLDIIMPPFDKKFEAIFYSINI